MRLYNQISGRGRPETRKGRVFRPFFLVVILAVVCWGFWTNNQRRMEAIAVRGIFADETGSLSKEHKNEVVALVKSFKKDFGVPLEVHILKRPPALNAHDASRIYLDVVPAQSRAYLFLPPLVRRAVGDDFIHGMEMSFQQDFASGDWRPGLVSAILALRAKLAEVTR